MQRMKLLIVLMLLVHQIVLPQTGHTIYSLTDCIKYAKSYNPDIKKASIEEEKADKKINEVIGSGLPQINLSGNLVNNLELPTQLLPGELLGAPGTFLKVKFGTKYNYTFTGDINQLLFSGSFWVGLSAAKYSKQYYQQNKELVSENIEYGVATAYYQILVVQKQLQLLQQNQKLVAKSLNDTKLLLANGQAKGVDVDRLNVSLNNLDYQAKKVQEGLKQAYKLLKYKMGMPVNSKLALADSAFFAQDNSLEQAINNLSYAGEVSSVYENRNDYKVLETSLELLRLDYKNQIAKYLPTLSAFGSYSYNANRSSFDLFDSQKEWFNYYSVGLRMQWPIFTGGQNYARIQQASLSIDGLNEDIKKAQNGIDLQLSNSITQYNTSFDNVKLNKQNIDIAKKVLDITAQEYKEGMTTAAILVDSETKLREAQTNYASSLLDLYIAKFDLEKAKGNLTSYINSIDNKN